MKIIRSRNQLDDFLAKNQSQWAFVPTMGNLHQGHLSLVETAKNYSKNVIVSIFVNPMQFGKGEDFATYPRTLESDISLLEGKIDALYLPTEACIYPNASKIWLDVPSLTNCLCGKFRPHFFNGVMTVLLKFILQINPKFLILGEKDYQQFLVVKEMVKSIGLNVEVVPSKTVRNENGLALSSRNGYLKNLQVAEKINKILLEAKKEVLEAKTFENAKKSLEAVCNVQYFELRNSQTLEEFKKDADALPFRLFFAGFIDGVRLIDNISIA